jgi:cobalt/nickel transport system permease protein
MPLTVAAVVAAGAAGVARLSGLAHRRFPEEERDWSVPSLAEEGEFSPLHQWDVRCKIVTVLLYSFVVASLTHLEPALAAVGISVVIAVIARAAFSKVMLRLVALAGFSGMLLVIMPFTVPAHPGDTVIVFNGFDWLGFNIRGVILATTIAAKAVAIALLMEPLLATAPLPVTLYGLSRLGVPEMVGQMVLLSHRYVHVVRHEARRMWAGMQVRGFNGRTDPETLRALAGFVGMLFVRSFERTERVSDAMRARGYKGRFPEPADLKFKAADALLATVWLAIGAILTVYDRLIL